MTLFAITMVHIVTWWYNNPVYNHASIEQLQEIVLIKKVKIQ